jgi:hypothetical protein
MRMGIQDLFAAMGEGGCLVFSILEYLEDKLLYMGDAIGAISRGIEAGCVAYNPNNPKGKEAGYVKDAIKFIFLLTGKKVKEVRTKMDGRQTQPIEGVINFWQLENAPDGVGHFTYGSWNSLENSKTVMNGFVRETRRYEVI